MPEAPSSAGPSFWRAAKSIPDSLVDARAATVQPSDTGVLFFSSGSTSKPKGILSAHRGVAIQLWRYARILALEGDVRCWTANGFFWSGNFVMALGGTFPSGGAIVLQPTFQPAEALELMQAERVNYPIGWAHQWPQLEDASELGPGGSQQRALCRSQHAAGPTSDGVDAVARAGLGVWQHRDLRHQHHIPGRHAGGGEQGQLTARRCPATR